MTDLRRWVSCRLMSILGYSSPVLVQYVITVSEKSSSSSEVVNKLIDLMVTSVETIEFANQIFARTYHNEAAMLARRRISYQILDESEIWEEDDGAAADRAVETQARSKRFRRRSEIQSESEEETRPVEKLTKENLDEGDGAAADRAVSVPLLPPKTEELPKKEEISIQRLRKLPRQEYLKKREKKKLDELRDDVEDDEITWADYHEQRKRKQIYEIVEKKIEESYDEQGCVNHENGYYAPLMQLYSEESRENYPIGKPILKSGAQDKKQLKNNDYDEFVLSGDRIEQGLPEPSAAALAPLTKLEGERKSLPIYAYKEELMKAVHDNQVLVIVGETGSGKTTQIPQFLEEAGYTQRGMIGCTQPRRVAAMSVAARVAQEKGVKLGHEVGYSIRFEDCTSKKTVLKYMTDGRLLHEFHEQLRQEPVLASYSVVMVDEAHERTVSTDILFGLLKDVARARPDFRLLICSATLDAEKFSEYFDLAPIFRIPGRRFPVEILYTKAPNDNYLSVAIATALKIHETEPPGDGDILVFLTGQEEIEKAEKIVGKKVVKTKMAELIICPMYANLPAELQGKVFEPTPKGARKLVLATNIAETSLTIDGIKYVVDCGFAKMKGYDHRLGMESLLVKPISKASANQRAGRSGRTGPGKCFRLYTSYDFYNELDDNTVPEIQRTNLANVVLTLKSLGVDDVLRFDFMDPPPAEALVKAMELLCVLGALDENDELTKVGEVMSEFPLDPMLSKMIIASEKYKCSYEIITIASLLSVGNSIFYRPKEREYLAYNTHRSFHMGNVGDHIALLNAFNSWKGNNFSTQWCYDNYVQARSMWRAKDIRDQLKGLLRRVGIPLTSNVNDLDAIKKAIASGFFPNSARLHKSRYKTVKNKQDVYIHPSSGLADVYPKWVIFQELALTTKEYMRQVTQVKPEWLLEIAPHYYKLEEVRSESET